MPISRGVAYAVVVGFLKSKAPTIFKNPAFKCSASFVHRLLQYGLKWSYRSATQAAQHLPNNWEKSCTDMAKRLAWLIEHHQVPESLVMNADQTGIVYINTGSKTWVETGTKQIQVIGKEEKQQFTIMPTITALGKVLPLQAIFAGKTNASLPSESARKPSEAKGFLYTSGGLKHWSNLKCMMEVCMHSVEKLFSIFNHIPFDTVYHKNCAPIRSVRSGSFEAPGESESHFIAGLLVSSS